MRFAKLLVLAVLASMQACKTPAPEGDQTALLAAGGDSDYVYEAQRILDLAPTKQCTDFASKTGIRVTKRENGEAVAGTIRVLGDNPNLQIYVIADYNGWGAQKTDEDKLAPVEGTPYYEGKIRKLSHGMEYRLLVNGEQRLDPAAVSYTHAPQHLNSVFWDFDRQSGFHMQTRSVDLRRKPLVIAESEVYELARKYPRQGGSGPSKVESTYRFVADSGLVDELKKAGYNAIELLPFNASADGEKWQYRYQVFGLFAPESRYGTPDEFARMIETFNQAGIGVIMDAVVGHYPKQGNDGSRSLGEIGLQRWRKGDGGALFGEVPSPWGTNRYDYANKYVRRFLSDSIVHMMCRYGITGIRFDNLDGIRLYDGPGGGGPEFLKEMTRNLREYKPESILIAEMFFGHNQVLQSLKQDGFGINFRTHSDLFDFFKDNMQKRTEEIDLGRLRNAIRGPWEWKEAARVQYITNHDEAANRRDGATGQYVASLVNGGGWYYVEHKTMAYGSVAMLSSAAYLDMPQMRLLQEGNFNENPAVDWSLLKLDSQKNVYSYFADLSKIVSGSEAFAFHNYNGDIEHHVDGNDDHRVISFLRKDGQKTWIAVVNLGHAGYSQYRVGTDAGGTYRVAIDSDDKRYGGSGKLEEQLGTGVIVADGHAWQGKQTSLSIPYLAPYATVLLRKD